MKLPSFTLRQNQELQLTEGKQAESIRYTSLILNPAKISLVLYEGWNREFEANSDHSAIAFISGPTFELSPHMPKGFTAHGDLKLANGTTLSKNRAASNSRASICITTAGLPLFGYGPLDKARSKSCRFFLGGLHSLSNSVVKSPSSYNGVYGKMHMSDVRIIYGLRGDYQIEVVETHDGVAWSDLVSFVVQKGFLAAYLPDHASKSRLIVPGKRLWSLDHAVWVSGGRPSITQMPFMVRIDELPKTASTR